MDRIARLAALASKQYSVFTHGQALRCGFSREQIKTEVRAGRWVRLFRGVYAFAGVPLAWQQRVMAACLACGPQAAASYQSAALVWGLSETEKGTHVTLPRKRVATHPGVTIHRPERAAVATYRGFHVTTPTQTIIDIAGTTDRAELARIVDAAHRRKLIDIDRMKDVLAEPINAKRPGSRDLRNILKLRDQGRPVGSVLETDLSEVLGRMGIPTPTKQHPVVTRTGTKYIDLAFPSHMLVLEVDGFEKYATPGELTYERARQNELELLGWKVLRFSWRQIHTDPVGVALTIAQALGLEPTRWRKSRNSKLRPLTLPHRG